MSEHCCGTGKFIAGMTLGTAAGTALGMTMALSHRQIKHAVRMVAKRMNPGGGQSGRRHKPVNKGLDSSKPLAVWPVVLILK